LRKHGAVQAHEATQKVAKRMGSAARAVFAAHARTLEGAIAKLKIARLVTGSGEGRMDGDGDLEAYQPTKADWFSNAITDVERLAKGGAA
jgi:hypothetical protein